MTAARTLTDDDVAAIAEATADALERRDAAAAELVSMVATLLEAVEADAGASEASA